jgi:CubicO group peptidase (beta-lactamase class C family)
VSKIGLTSTNLVHPKRRAFERTFGANYGEAGTIEKNMMRNLRAAAIGLLIVLVGTPVLAGVTHKGHFRIEYAGSAIGSYANLDNAVMAWMRENDIHAAQLAVRNKGKLIFSHAYTMDKSYNLVITENVFRLASVSKMLATAAYSQLVSQGRLTGTEHIFRYLGIHEPLLRSQTPDPRINEITTVDLEQHTSGMPGSGFGDPLFEMRDIEVQLGSEPLRDMQFAKYLYGVPLIGDPGKTAVYSNVGYFLLGEVIQKAAGMTYFDYVTQALLHPLGMKNWSLSATSQAKVNPMEVFADDPYTGPSVFDISPNSPTEPFIFEGGDIVWEVAAAPADAVSNAESVSRFIHTWNVYGTGGRQYDYARSGCVPGVATWAESLNADVDFALLFNKQPCLDFPSTVIKKIESDLRGL